MPKITGKITKQTLSEDKSRYWLTIEGFDNNISGFCPIPEDIQKAIDNATEVAVPYHTVESGGKTYYNYGDKPAAKKTGGDGKLEGVLTQLIATLNAPKAFVRVEKTIQEKEYEPIKISTSIGFPLGESIDPAKIEAAIKIAMTEVTNTLNKRMGQEQLPEKSFKVEDSKEKPKPAPKEEPKLEPASQVKSIPKPEEKTQEEKDQEDSLEF